MSLPKCNLLESFGSQPSELWPYCSTVLVTLGRPEVLLAGEQVSCSSNEKRSDEYNRTRLRLRVKSNPRLGSVGLLGELFKHFVRSVCVPKCLSLRPIVESEKREKEKERECACQRVYELSP